ncbi:basic helix-loop-helix (bHLH) DNA-bindingsuperfamily protein [Striga asiatica]|uniref:Basic helix-loop-helix (BHLH) DNA-bindingsuperfamily protein n=1 Tax=Striga asiatica TaxID=4170 RepID=A0A5A7QHS4_STRAF|nr:basic helix-loop-helix (bHLH) DNA-bindingsuperfamily protein [Striga asiatica]
MMEDLGGCGAHDDILAMAAQGLAGQDTFFWDDSCSFPILADNKGKDEVAERESLAANPKKRKAGGDEKKSEHDQQQHIWIERERRKKMRDMFANLHALMPHLPPRADKATIVDEAVVFIQKLQQTLGALQTQKAQRLYGNAKVSAQTREAFIAEQVSTSRGPTTSSNPSPLIAGGPIYFKTWTSPNVILSACGKDAQINICCPTKPCLLAVICFVLDKYKIEVLSGQVSSGVNRSMFMLQVRATGPLVQLSGSSLVVEEIFKQAAAELMVWVQPQDGHV